MTCDQATFMLERRWDKTLNGDEERALDEHILGCAVCSAEAQAIALADKVFVQIPDCKPTVDIAAAVAKRIAEEAPAEPNRAWFFGAVALLAAAMVAIWRFGMPVPSALITGSHYAALHNVAATSGSMIASWLKPVVTVLRSAEPLLPVLIPVLAILATAEMALFGRWAFRRGGSRHAAGQV